MIKLRILYGHLQCLLYTVIAVHKRVIPSTVSTTDSEKVIINSVRIYNLYNWSIELAFYHVMKSKGFSVKFLIDDGILFSHQYKNRLHEKYPRRVWMTRYFLKLYKILVPSVYKDILIINNLKHVSVSETFNEGHLLSSITRFYLSLPDMKYLSTEVGFHEVKRRTEEDCRVMSAVTSVLDKEGYKFLFSSHGFYSSWGPTYEYFRRNGQVLTYGGDGFRNACINLSRTEPAAEKLVTTENFDRVYSVSRKFIQKLNRERNHERVNWQSVDSDSFQIGDEAGSKKELELLRQKYQRTVGIIPNVLWDNAVVSEEVNTIFNSPVDWLLDLIDFAKSNANIGFVIRVHPSENSIMFARKGVGELLNETVRGVENIVLIQKHSKFKTPLLFEFCDLFTVYNGTFGLECMYNSVPVLFAGRSNFESIISLGVSSKEEYFDRLSKGIGANIPDREVVELLYYYYFELNQYQLNILDKSHRIKSSWSSFDTKDFERIMTSLYFETK